MIFIRKLFPLCVAILIALYACNAISDNAKTASAESSLENTPQEVGTYLTDIPFTIARNYFVRHETSAASELVIHSREDFEQAFGNASQMGQSGESTPIDFNEQFVIALVFNNTDFATEVRPLDLRHDSHENLKLRYALQVGEKQIQSLQPSLLLVVNKEYLAPVRFDRVD